MRRMFVWQGAQVALLGVVVGALAAVGLTTHIQALLFNVQRFDVTAFAGMSAVMLAVTDPLVFNLTQKGKELTGTAGPTEQQWKIEKGEVNAGKATFQVQQPNGPLFKFTLTIVKGRLQGDMTGERDGVVRGKAKVDAGKAK
ncbi:MAG TPA: hypothetical protein VES67_02225 [Vicinamibacterales bacterium]|nr:hypothetical protein [Vicinamibacterales bacterium]